jgi:hypothetical protein
MTPEGWYCDPFGCHQHRWFSSGWPTDLVRDAGHESHDAPPVGDYVGPLVESDDTAVNGEDLLHSDNEATRAYDPSGTWWDLRHSYKGWQIGMGPKSRRMY